MYLLTENQFCASECRIVTNCFTACILRWKGPSRHVCTLGFQGALTKESSSWLLAPAAKAGPINNKLRLTLPLAAVAAISSSHHTQYKARAFNSLSQSYRRSERVLEPMLAGQSPRQGGPAKQRTTREPIPHNISTNINLKS